VDSQWHGKYGRGNGGRQEPDGGRAPRGLRYDDEYDERRSSHRSDDGYDDRQRGWWQKDGRRSFEQDVRRNGDSRSRRDEAGARRSGYQRDTGYQQQYDRDRDLDRQTDAPQYDLEDFTSGRIWVGGCPNDISEREVEKEFSRIGDVEEVVIKHSARDTFLFVQFARLRDAKDAIRNLDQVKAFGGVIKVAPARYNPPKDGGKGSKDGDRRGDGGGKGSRDGEGKGRYSAGSRRSDNYERYDDRQGYGGGSGSNMRDDYELDRQSGYGRRGGDYDCDRRRGDYDAGPRRGRSPAYVARSRPGNFRPRSRSRGYTREPVQRGPRFRVSFYKLPKDMEADELLEICEEYGQVINHELNSEMLSKSAWVEYKTIEEAKAAIEQLDDRRMQDWDMRIRAYLTQTD